MNGRMNMIVLANEHSISFQMLSIAKKFIAAGITVLLLGVVPPSTLAGTFSEVTGFGSNPGNLRMFKYIPDNLKVGRPLVVALHGCRQSASAYDDGTGWTRFADQLGFALLLPEQKSENNPISCFNWFSSSHIDREEGEALIDQTNDRQDEG